MHPSESELQMLADGELPAEVAERLRLHLDQCAQCASRLRGLRLAEGQIAEWLRVIDHPAPRLDAEVLMARAHHRHTPHGLLAAGVATLLVAAAAAAAVVPGSPVREFVQRTITEWRGAGGPSAENAPQGAEPTPRQSGVSFVPEPELEIVFLRAQTGGAITLSLVEAQEVRVREVGGTAGYEVDPAELIVDNRNARGSYEILLPRALRNVRVRIGERVVFQKEGSAISSQGSVDGQGRHVVLFGAVRDADP